MRHMTTALAVAMLFGVSASLTSHAAIGNNNEAMAPASVLAFDQKLSDGKVVVDYANLPVDGYVAVYGTDKSGKPMGEPLGYSKIEAGDHRKLSISLKKQPEPGQTLWLALYKDTDREPSFKPGDGDKPVWSKVNLPPENKILVR